MSIANKIAARIKAKGKSRLEGMLGLSRDMVLNAGGVFLRAASEEDGVKTGWVYGFSDGSRIVINVGSPVVLPNGGVDYLSRKGEEKEKRQ